MHTTDLQLEVCAKLLENEIQPDMCTSKPTPSIKYM